MRERPASDVSGPHLCLCCPLVALLQSLFAGLSCRAHQRSAVRSLPPSRKAKVGDGEELKVATRADDHEAWQCRCYAVDCQHIVQLHMALLTVAGYAHVESGHSLRTLPAALAPSLILTLLLCTAVRTG